MKINEAFLEEGLERLEKARAWSPRVVSKLETLIRTSEDDGLLRVGPLHFAAEKNIREQEAVDLFLHSAAGGLFSIDWSLTCPTCGEVVESFKALKNIHASFGCNLCRTTLETTLDEMIQVSFTISPRVREIKFHFPDSLSAEDYYLRYRFDQHARYPDGTRFVDVWPSLRSFFQTIAPGQTTSVDLDCHEGWLVMGDLENDAGLFLALDGSPGETNEPVELVLRRDARLVEGPARRAGQLRVQLTNAMQVPSRVFGFNEPPDEPPPLIFDRVLTGKRVLSTQTFRDLFRNEVVSTTEGLTVRDISILFTDLKGSTALYDRIGDLKAFNLVRQHFDSLGKVILSHDGAIVKTIGDAIMASFLSPIDAVRAARAMLQEIDEFNRGLARREVVLKVGIHRGASIAVTLNDRLDYFGQMVNVASRVQGLADADEICLTQEVYETDGVPEALKGTAVVRETSLIKGVQGAVVFFRVRPGSIDAA